MIFYDFITMMKELVTVNRKEQKRLVVLNEVETSKMIGREAVEVIGLSLRHVRRLLAAAETPPSVGTLRRGCAAD